MVLLMTIACYPPHKQLEVQNKFFETVNKYPYDETLMKRVVRIAVRITKDGYEVMNIYDIPEGKYTEAFNRAASNIHEYSTIEGYTSEIRTYLSGEEAFKIIGKKLPE
jgi:hypothetical protein